MKQSKPIAQSKLYYRLNTIRKHIMGRCNNPNSKDYKYYGGIGVTYDRKWETFQGFLEDVDLIDGWDEDLFNDHQLQLDKDLKIEGNKHYSKDTCMWASPLENVGLRPNFMKAVIARGPYGETKRFFNKAKFARDNSFTHEGINNVLNGNQVAHKYWQFRHEDSLEDFPFYDEHIAVPEKVKVKTRTLDELVFHSYESCAKALTEMYGENIYGANVSSVARGIRRHCKGHVIKSYYDDSPFPDDEDMPEKDRYRDIEVSHKDGSLFVIKYTERIKTYNEIGVDPRRVADFLKGNIKEGAKSLKGYTFKLL